MQQVLESMCAVMGRRDPAREGLRAMTAVLLRTLFGLRSDLWSRVQQNTKVGGENRQFFFFCWIRFHGLLKNSAIFRLIFCNGDSPILVHGDFPACFRGDHYAPPRVRYYLVWATLHPLKWRVVANGQELFFVFQSQGREVLNALCTVRFHGFFRS